MHFAVWRRMVHDFGVITGYRSACGQGHQRAVNTDAVDCLQCKSTDAFKAAQQPRNEHEGKETK